MMTALKKEAEIREIPDATGALELGLFVEGTCRATAMAGATELEAMEQLLGKSRDDVANDLEHALESWFNDELEKVQIENVRQSDGLKYLAQYTYRTLDKVHVGHVWYDVKTGQTGPDESVPAVVRNKMRTRVHDLLSPPPRRS